MISMPKGGPRPNAGRKMGVPNKATIERRETAARDLDALRTGQPGKQLGKEVLEEMMSIAKGTTATFQRITPEQARAAQAAGQNLQAQEGDLEKFGEWWDRTVYAATQLAKYQSPTFKAIMVSTPGEANQPAMLIEQPDADLVDNTADSDVDRAQQTYLRLVRGD